MKFVLSFLFVAGLMFGSVHVANATTYDPELIERGEQMMEWMIGDDHEAYDQQLVDQYGQEYVDRLHANMGQMSGSMWSRGGWSRGGMMGMMGGFDDDWGSSGMMGSGFWSIGIVGWLWTIIWTLNSVLIGVWLWKSIQRNGKK